MNFVTSSTAIRDASRTAVRPPPKAAMVLLPVWGYKYARHFLTHGLPTLLAPGNIPALAQALPTQFVLLTSVVDETYIRQSAAFKKLAAICPVEIRLIDHLITAGNSSTTITLAYTESVRAAGEDIQGTCFFFLVSDYIMADGTLRNVLDRMRQGASGVLSGNFQVTLEDALPWLQEKLRFTESSQSLELKPREMMRWALDHLHPATVGNIVNFPLNHNGHCNRLFWRVGSNALLGRFFLMHMLCIRPEVSDFTIGSSCDYSFIPEMCPSGNVQAMTDSDECLIVEMQPRDHEAAFLRPGPLKPETLARSLEEWATADHRGNAKHSIVFHADEIPNALQEAVSEADRFLTQTFALFRREPHPHRGHDYWRGAIAAFNEATGRKLTSEERLLAFGYTTGRNRLKNWIMWQAQHTLLGRPPFVNPLHPAWPDYRLILQGLAPFFRDPKARLLMVSDQPTVFTTSLADNGEKTHRLQMSHFLASPPERYEPLETSFDFCLIELTEGEMARGDVLIDRVALLLKPNATILLSIRNGRSGMARRGFGQGVSYHSARLLRASAVPVDIQYVPSNWLRGNMRGWFSRLRGFTTQNPVIGVPSAIVGGGLLMAAGAIGSFDGLRRPQRIIPRGAVSSLLLTLRVEGYQPKRAAGGSYFGEFARHTPTLTSNKTLSADRSETTREEQYSRCVEIKRSNGLTPLGLMTNQVWYDDPRRLTFVLARYKFVAKMLNGRKHVGEVGCGDAFGSRIVLQETKAVTVYDFDPTFIDDVKSRHDPRWPLSARVHDITEGPLPEKHDGIFSLDVLEHITELDEHAYIANLRGSLTSDGVLIIGSPSLESQTYASPLSKAGHVNCKTGDQLKSLLQQYFSGVFVFSMNDEMVHTGYYPMAHYLFAICTGPK